MTAPVPAPARPFRGSMRTAARHSRGFTLAELLVVVVILVVLAAIAVPMLSAQSKKARYATAQNTVTATARLLATGQSTGGTATVAGGILTVDTPANGSTTLNTGNASIITGGSEIGAGNNLLTADQASFETSSNGLYNNSGGVVARSSAFARHGSWSYKYTNTNGRLSLTSSPRTPVTQDGTYTYALDLYAEPGVTHLSASLWVFFYNSSGGLITSTPNDSKVPATGAWTTYQAQKIAPAGAVSTSMNIYENVTPLNAVYYVDRAGIWEGTSTVWAMPGTSASSLDLGAGTWCVAVPDPTDSTKYIRQKAGEAAATAVTAASAAAACA